MTDYLVRLLPRVRKRPGVRLAYPFERTLQALRANVGTFRPHVDDSFLDAVMWQSIGIAIAIEVDPDPDSAVSWRSEAEAKTEKHATGDTGMRGIRR